MTDDPTARPDRISTDDGETLEAAWSGPNGARVVAVLTHPHPAYGGDMDNIVPASLARSLPEHGVATLRVNFRGTGASTGRHGGGPAEVADVRAAVDAAAEAAGETGTVVAVGYSFGADVLLALDHDRLAAVVAVAPPLAVVDTSLMAAARTGLPTLVLSPAHDQFRPPEAARDVIADWPATSLEPIDGADHFVAGATDRISDRVVLFLDTVRDRRLGS